MTDQPAAPDSLPLNDLESKLAKAGQPDANPVDVILSFLNNEVYILSTDSLDKPDAAVEPLVLANSEGQPVLAVFSHPSRWNRTSSKPRPTSWAPTVQRFWTASATSWAW
nr:SseB family protein [Arthrobacter sp. Hiyo1]